MRRILRSSPASAIALRLREADLFALRGVPSEYHAGMRAFWLDSLFASISDAFYGTYTSLYVLALGGTRTEVGWLASASSFLGMVMPIPGASLTRRWGQRKRMVVVFSVLFRLMLLLAALVPLVAVGRPALYAILALSVLRVGFVNFFAPAWVSLTRDVVPLTSRGRYFASRNLMMALTSMVMVPLAGQIIQRMGAPRGYQLTLGIAFAVGLVASYTFSLIPETRKHGVRGVTLKAQVRSLWEALTSDRIFLVFVLVRLLWDFGLQIGGPYFAVYQVEQIKATPGFIGVLATISAGTRMIGLRVWGPWLDRHGARWVTTVAALGIPILPVIWAVSSRPWHLILAELPGGFLWAGFEMGIFALFLELLHGEDNTQAAAGYMALSSGVSILGPFIGGWLIAQTGYAGNFLVSGAIRLVAALLFLVVLKPFRHAHPSPESVASA